MYWIARPCAASLMSRIDRPPVARSCCTACGGTGGAAAWAFRCQPRTPVILSAPRRLRSHAAPRSSGFSLAACPALVVLLRGPSSARCACPIPLPSSCRFGCCRFDRLGGAPSCSHRPAACSFEPALSPVPAPLLLSSAAPPLRCDPLRLLRSSCCFSLSAGCLRAGAGWAPWLPVRSGCRSSLTARSAHAASTAPTVLLLQVALPPDGSLRGCVPLGLAWAARCLLDCCPCASPSAALRPAALVVLWHWSAYCCLCRPSAPVVLQLLAASCGYPLLLSSCARPLATCPLGSLALAPAA